MGSAAKFNWVLQIAPPAVMAVGHQYEFRKPDVRLFPINVPIDLIDPVRTAVAKIKITSFSTDGTDTTGIFSVIKLYEGLEKQVLTNYWIENQ